MSHGNVTDAKTSIICDWILKKHTLKNKNLITRKKKTHTARNKIRNKEFKVSERLLKKVRLLFLNLKFSRVEKDAVYITIVVNW